MSGKRYIATLMTALVMCCLFLWLIPQTVCAAPAEGATVEHSGTSGTVTWEIYSDGTMVIRPTEGNEGTMESLNGGSNGAPWYSNGSAIKSVETQGTIHLGSNASYMFYQTANCTSMNLSGFNTSEVTDMSNMFNGIRVTNLDLSGWDTSRVIKMSDMFSNSKATSLGDLSSWNTSNVTDMSSMFYNSAVTNLDLHGWNTSKVMDMSSMFRNSVATSFDLSDWNTSKVTDMRYMFSYSKATSLDLSGWDTSSVTKMNNMFSNCSSLTSLSVGNWNTGEVTNMNSMFSNCSGLTSLSVGNWNTDKVTNMNSMFKDCKNLTTLPVDNWNVSSVIDMCEMFYNCDSLSYIPVSNRNTENVTNIRGMFFQCRSLTAVPVGSWNTGNVTNMNAVFQGCSKLTSLPIENWDTGSVTNMGNMFSGCTMLSSLPVENWNTEKVLFMDELFSGCSALATLPVNRWNTSQLTNAKQMFYLCKGITSLDLSEWDTSKVTNMSEMFRYNRNLSNLDISGWDTSRVMDMKQMFSNCSKLASVTLGENFRFKGGGITDTSNQAILPNPPSSTTTRKWIRDDGTIESKTRQELRDNYDDNATLWAGTWVWEPLPTTYTVKFNPPAGGSYGGAMPDQKITAAEAGKLNKNGFFRFDYTFDHWNGSDGKTYTDEQTIPANTFNIGDTLTLTAVFTKNTHTLNFIDGVAEFVLHAGEKAVFSGLPGGSTYQVWEETPSGWQLTGQVNAAGQVVPNGTVNVEFTNRYVPGTATITLMAQKSLDGHLPDDGAFSFELIDAENAVVETVSNNAAGMIEFAPIIFRQPGTFVYKIREVRGDDTSINYDTHEEVITVTVQDDGHGNLTAVSSSTGTLPHFENESKPGTLTITKQAQGGSASQTFTFEIELTNEYGQSLDSVIIVGDTD